MINEATPWCLLVSFDDYSDSFTHGFEAGMLWEKLSTMTSTEPFCSTVHTANRTTVTRMATARGWVVEFTDTEYPEWTYAVFERQPTLRLVK